MLPPVTLVLWLLSNHWDRIQDQRQSERHDGADGGQKLPDEVKAAELSMIVRDDSLIQASKVTYSIEMNIDNRFY